MKKKLCALILAMACVCSLGTTGASAAGMDEQEGYSTTVISGEDAIQAYRNIDLYKNRCTKGSRNGA